MIEAILHLGLVEETELELDKAALDIAFLDNPDADLAAYGDLLDGIEALLRARAARARTPAEQGALLAAVLGDELGFLGDSATYDDPANADMIRMIDRRRGLPVTLAILYVAMARRLGWTAHALNTPRHVLVGLGRPATVIIDPFGGGAPVRPADLSLLLRSAFGRMAALAPEYVAPMSNRTVLVRLMMNQATRAERAEQYARALAVWRRITTVAPGYSHGWWEQARLEQAGGDAAAARRSLSAMLETTRDPAVRAQVTNALDALAG